MRLGHPGIEGQRTFKACERVLISLQCGQDAASLVEDRSVIGLEQSKPVELRERFLQAVQPE